MAQGRGRRGDGRHRAAGAAPGARHQPAAGANGRKRALLPRPSASNTPSSLWTQALWTAFTIRSLASPALAALSTPTYYALTALPLAAGTTSVLWMAEEITRTGIGQGTSVVISLSIVGAYAGALRALLPQVLSGAVPPLAVAAVAAAVLAQTAVAVLTVEGVRKVPIAFFQLQGGAGGAGGAAAAEAATALRDDHIPFRANPTGIQPVLFAVCLLDGVPWLLAQVGAPAAAMAALSALLTPERGLYYIAYFAVVFAFSFLDVEDTPAEVSEYILKVGARVPGVRPGDATVAYLRHTQNAARAWGGLLLAALSTASMLADKWMHAALGKSIGFTSMLIIVRAPPAAACYIAPDACCVRAPCDRRAPSCRCGARCAPTCRSRRWTACSSNCERVTWQQLCAHTRRKRAPSARARALSSFARPSPRHGGAQRGGVAAAAARDAA